jgi:AAA+ superfamily predicted ATPase
MKLAVNQPSATRAPDVHVWHALWRALEFDDWRDRSNTFTIGINALFASASGTGKTMAAEALANELKLQLYQIDLSSCQ